MMTQDGIIIPVEAAARLVSEYSLAIRLRQSGIAGQYYLEFELHALPRRGDEKIFRTAPIVSASAAVLSSR